MTNRPIILFDVMETLVTEPFFSVVPEFFGMTTDELLAAKHPSSWIEFEKGLISEEQYFSSFFSDGRAVDGRRLRRCMQESYRWMDGMRELLQELKSCGYEMHALSNYSIWYRLIERSLQLSRYLQWTFVSCLTGVRKPDRRAYLGAAEALKVEPAQCLFIDDRRVNVDAALEVTMDAILMRDARQVRRELVERTLIGPATD